VRVLSHNDIANGNILSNRDGQFALIDFEYVSATPPGYDIGNLLVFVLRTCLERNKIPTVDDFTAFHRGLVETYVEHARALGFTHDRDLVFEASALAFVNRLVRTPKAIRTLLRSKETPVGHKLILLQVMAGMLDALTGTGVQPEALSAAAAAPREAGAGRGS
jgi:hypothetical protein